MNNIFLSLCSVLALEFFIRLNITSKLKYFNNLLKKIQKKLLSKKNTDYTKEKALKKYSINLLKQTLIIFFSILFIMSPFFLFIALDYFFQLQFIKLIASSKGIFMSIVIAIIYGKLREYIVK